MKKMLNGFTYLDQNDYGEDKDCSLVSITAVIYYHLKKQYNPQTIYNTVERIAKKYGYRGNVGTNSLVIKKIFEKSLKELTKKDYKTKMYIFRFFGFAYNAIMKQIDKGNPVILSFWRCGKYKNHTVIVIGYDKENKTLVLADNWFKGQRIVKWNQVSIISQINYL